MERQIQGVDFLEHLKHMAEDCGDPGSGLLYLKNQFGMFRLSNVYHYTDISGFISIMQNRELWASHIAFMNDKSEYLHGKDLFQKQIEKTIPEVADAKKQFLKAALESLNQEKSSWVFPTSSKDVFSISFSYNRDSLEMWRGYGKDSGIAIGFDFAKCHSLPGMCLIREEMYKKLLEKYNHIPENVCPDYELLFFPISVLYEDDQKQEAVKQAIEIGIKCFESREKTAREIAELSASELLSNLMFNLIPLLKHRGFSGEAECRFVDNSIKRGDDAYRIHYRNRGGIILPYIKYKLMDLNCRPLKEMPICEIVVGPGLKQAKVVESVKYFLERNQMENLVDKVRASDIPYIDV